MTRAVRCLSRFANDRSGATAIEYGLIAALICVAAIGGMRSFSGALVNMWDKVDSSVAGAN